MRFPLTVRLLFLVVASTNVVMAQFSSFHEHVGADDFGQTIVGVPDVDGDGFDDYAVGDPGFMADRGRVTMFSGAGHVELWFVIGHAPGDRFGFDLALHVWDPNLATPTRVVVGAPGVNGEMGAVYLLESSSGASVWPTRFEGIDPGGQLGFSVATADGLGDDLGDVAAGAPTSDLFGVDAGQVTIIDGFMGLFLYNHAGVSDGDQFGYDVGTTDFDGNGHRDVIVGSPFEDAAGNDSGAVRVLGRIDLPPGAPLPIGGSLTVNLITIHGETSLDRFGAAVGGGDVNDDGMGDIAVGAPREGGGRVRVFAGPNGAMLHDLAGQAFDEYGIALEVADVNGDAHDDLVIGATESFFVGLGQSGYVHVVSGYDGTTIGTVGGQNNGDDFGHAVGAIDTNGDGLLEIIVGTPIADTVDIVGLVPTNRGAREDFVLRTIVQYNTMTSSSHAPTGAWPDVHPNADPGDVVEIRLESPNGIYDGEIPLLVAEAFATGTPPISPVGFPEVHVTPSGAVILFDGTPSGFIGPQILPPAGMHFAFEVPPGFAGMSVMLQGIALAPSAHQGNPFFTATNAHEVQLVP